MQSAGLFFLTSRPMSYLGHFVCMSKFRVRSVSFDRKKLNIFSRNVTFKDMMKRCAQHMFKLPEIKVGSKPRITSFIKTNIWKHI
jgi:hypothetical protein